MSGLDIRRQLSRLPFHRAPWTAVSSWLVAVVGILLVVGLVMSFSASFVDAAVAGDAFATFRRQLMWAAIGIPAFVFASLLDPRVWRRLAWPMMLIALIGLVLLLVPGVGDTRYGSTRWIGIGPLSVQPSEIAKLSALLWLADVLERKRPRDGAVHTLEHLMVPALPLLLVMAALVLLQPDLGTTILLGMIIGAVVWVEGLPGRYVAGAIGVGGVAIAMLAVIAPYRLARIRGWLSPEAYPLDEGFQLLQSWYALGSGGVFGVGLGSSRGKWNFIPNPETDFIFAVIGEELGLVGSLGVLALFTMLFYLGLKTAYLAAPGFPRTVALSVTVWIVGQALVNIATVIGLLPITGVTLPLVSVGGSSLVSTLVALGILTAIARSSAIDGPQPARRGVDTSVRGGRGGRGGTGSTGAGSASDGVKVRG